MIINNCYNANGAFLPALGFSEMTGTIPNTFSLTFNEESQQFDIEKITNDLIQDSIPHVTSITRKIFKYTSVGDNQSKAIPFKLVLSDSNTRIIITAENKISTIIYSIENDSITAYYNILPDVESKLIELSKKLPKKNIEPKEATVNLVAYTNGDYYTIESKIKRTNLNLEENYNDDFVPVYNDIISFLESRDSGLIMLYGTQGSGKTSLIRHLCSNKPGNYIIVPTSITTRLGDPDFISFMIDNSNSIFILEDCEQVLMDRGVNMFNGAISNILNMSDGLLSDIMNIKFICTFNANISTIDPALLRRGRCFAKYEFKELSEDKVEKLNNKYNLGLKTIKPMTLADIYNSDKTEYANKQARKIGF